jgi:hypothetical protein
MTILAGIMRNAGRHSNLVDIVRFSPLRFREPAGRSELSCFPT